MPKANCRPEACGAVETMIERDAPERVTPLADWPTATTVRCTEVSCEHQPGWYHNLVTHPIALVEIGATTWNVRARVARSPERGRLLDRIARLSPQVAGVVEHTRREMPIIVLDRIESPA
jgi:hypothetical protein